jgi:hypothetical protein
VEQWLSLSSIWTYDAWQCMYTVSAAFGRLTAA